MDTELLRTFLEVERTRHFGRAAENLFITPSAVGARIRLLEASLGTQVFLRKRQALEPTLAGVQLKMHAELILSNWHRACDALARANATIRPVSLLAETGLYECLALPWLQRLYQHMPALSLSLSGLSKEQLVPRIRERKADLGLSFQAPQSELLHARKLMDFDLLLVSGQQGLSIDALDDERYLQLDWGAEFLQQATQAGLWRLAPAARLDAPGAALAMLLASGGVAYLPDFMVLDLLTAGRLHAVAGAQSIARQVFLVYRKDLERDLELDEMVLHWPGGQDLKSD